MNIEEELFKNAKLNFKNLSKYGFKKDKTLYKYSKNIMNDTFRVDIEINNQKIVRGKVYDLAFDEEYTNFRIESACGFIEQVREEFKKVLIDIRNNCCTIEAFKYPQTNRIIKAIQTKYKDNPSFEWEKFPLFAVFKNKDSQKWYALIMNIAQNKLDKKSRGEVEVINLKLKPDEIEDLLKQKGFYPAYHMNKKNWITIKLNNTIKDEKIMKMIDESYAYTIPKN